jgi:hypothetical protein
MDSEVTHSSSGLSCGSMGNVQQLAYSPCCTKKGGEGCALPLPLVKG